jgi:hypothetical protein
MTLCNCPVKTIALKICLCFLCIMQFVAAQPQSGAIDGTTGTPLGGIGCGAIKYWARFGTFSGTFRTPCALDNFSILPNTQFQFYSRNGSWIITRDKLSAVLSNGRVDDDAVYPVHYANFGTINGVSIRLTAFSPVNLADVDQMCYPYAFYEIQVTNTAAADVEASVAFQVNTSSIPVIVAGKGLRTTQGPLRRAVYAASDDTAAVISSGSDNLFFANGRCSNTAFSAINRVAVKVTLAAGQSRRLKFVYAWHNDVNGAEGDYGMFYYLNTFSDAGAVADTGRVHFDFFRDNAVSLVRRMRASNFPDWIKNQALVTLANLTNNSMYRKDGRYAHTEGEWSISGTNDQMWHARQIYAMMVPSLNWQELQYWARTQKADPEGQIHHDIDNGTSHDISYMCLWDDRQHADYREIDLWVDLDCGFIISVYETFIATGDTARLASIWPYVKKAAQRILTLAGTYGSAAYPFTFDGSENSYDFGGQPDPYNASLSMPTYKILSKLSEIQGEPALKQTFDSAFTGVVASFKARYLTAGNFPAGRISESVMAGQWLAYYLKFGDLFDTADINYAFRSLDGYYSPATQGLGFTGGTYKEWAPYLVAHYGGLSLQTGRFTDWRSIQYDWYERIFYNRNLVYNQPLDIPPKVTTPLYLASDPSGFFEYISIPVVWRNYYTMAGYFRNKHTGELWLEPAIPPEMNHQMTDAFILSSEGCATISCDERDTASFAQTIWFRPDSPVAVSAIYVKDKGAPAVYAWVNDSPRPTPERFGSGYGKELKITWAGTVTAAGIKVSVSGNPTSVKYREKYPLPEIPVFTCTATSIVITTRLSCAHQISIFSPNGKLIARRHGFGEVHYRFGTHEQQNGPLLKPGAYLVQVRCGGAPGKCSRAVLVY